MHIHALDCAVDQIVSARRSMPTGRSALVAISGIDGCGKGYLTARIVTLLQAKGLRVAAINIDGWLNLPGKRFDPGNPAEHFYSHAIRFAEMFDQLVLPPRDQRSVRIQADYAEETATGLPASTASTAAASQVLVGCGRRVVKPYWSSTAPR